MKMTYPSQIEFLDVMNGARDLAITDTPLNYAARHFGIFPEEAYQIKLFGKVLEPAQDYWNMVRSCNG